MDMKLEPGFFGGWTWHLSDNGKWIGTGTAPTREKAWLSMSETAIDWLQAQE